MQVVGDPVEEMSLAADEVKDAQQQEMWRVNTQLQDVWRVDPPSQRRRRVDTPL